MLCLHTYIYIFICSYLLTAVGEFNTAYMTGKCAPNARLYCRSFLAFFDFRFSDIYATTTTLVFCVCEFSFCGFQFISYAHASEILKKIEPKRKKIYFQKQKNVQRKLVMPTVG